jgi:hypothetical protein
MLRPLQLLLPALLPSWGFFDYIQPSPRIQYQLLDAQQQPLHDWLEFRPRPQRVSLMTCIGHLFCNPRWNETLFLMSCAERLIEHPTAHSELQILHCIARDWRSGPLHSSASASHAQFRLIFVRRQQTTLVEEIHFVSRVAALAAYT